MPLSSWLLNFSNHGLYPVPISRSFSGLGHSKQLLVEAIVKLINERGDIHRIISGGIPKILQWHKS